MIAMGLYYEGVRICLIKYTNGITENITKITWRLGIGGTPSKGGTVTVSHSVKYNIMVVDTLENPGVSPVNCKYNRP